MADPPSEDFSSLSLPDRFVHKNWKARKSGYEEAVKAFEKTADESDPVFRQFLQDTALWKGAAADSNVAAQQEGLNALCAFLKYGGKEHATRTRNSTVTSIVEKGLVSTRAAIKQSALEALLQYIELDKADPIVEDVLPALSNKQPKIIAASLSALTAIFHAYGVKIVDPKPVLKAVPKCFAHADKTVRAEASNLVVELYRWLREAIKTLFWNDLKPLQQQELEKLFDAVKQEPSPKQARLLRSQQAAVASAPKGGGGGEVYEDEEAGEEPEEVDVFDLAEPVDVLSKIPKDFYENLASTKWKDRKETLDALYAVVHVDRIQDGQYDELVSALARCMKDANIAVVTVAANSVEVLAKGLRRSFAKYRSRIMGPMFERLKEKKQSVADALGAALDAVFQSTSLSECSEETLEFLKHKNPQVKLETLRFLIRCLKTTRDAPSPPETKAIAEAAIKLLTESNEVTRSGGAEILGTLMKIKGERGMNQFLDGLDEIRKTKIKEYFDAAEVKAKERPPKPAAAAAKAATAGPKKNAGKKPPAGLGTKKQAIAPGAPSPVEETAPKPGIRPGASKLAGPSKSGLAPPSGGLKLQKKNSAPAVAASSGPLADDEPAAPRAGLSRGLAGRPLGKASSAIPSSEPAPPPPPPAPSALTVVQLAELDELRLDRDRLQRANEELRADKARLETQVHELKSHEADLIEERTHHTLTIKAKETQLSRSRGEVESASETIRKQQREIDRLKRELARVVRAPSPPPAYVGADHLPHQQIYSDAAASNGAVAGVDRYERDRLAKETGYQRARSYMSSPSEEKENGGGPDAVAPGKDARPARFSRQASDASRAESPRPANGAAAPGGGIDSWKRAAEVTTQLKVRIEQMKARQALNRPH